MIEILCQVPGVSQFIRIPLPENSGTWECTDILNQAAYIVPAGTRRPSSVVNGNSIIDLQMAQAIWDMHAAPILELRRRIEA